MPAPMEVIAFLAPFVLLGVGIIFVAFSGGPGAARLHRRAHVVTVEIAGDRADGDSGMFGDSGDGGFFHWL